LYQHACETIQIQEQTHSQAKGVQLVEAPINELQQLGTKKKTFPSNTHIAGGKKGTTSNFNSSISDTSIVIPTMEVEYISR
jgi:hypothetical protein